MSGRFRRATMGLGLAAVAGLMVGAPEFVREVRELAASFGVPQGAIDRLIAQAHAGSHELCDAGGLTFE